jgi:hypothetical protein
MNIQIATDKFQELEERFGNTLNIYLLNNLIVFQDDSAISAISIKNDYMINEILEINETIIDDEIAYQEIWGTISENEIMDYQEILSLLVQN